MRTEEERKAERDALVMLLRHVPERNKYGGNNHEEIGLQLVVLIKRYDERQARAYCNGMSLEETQAALIAARWLHGKTVNPPTALWLEAYPNAKT